MPTKKKSPFNRFTSLFSSQPELAETSTAAVNPNAASTTVQFSQGAEDIKINESVLKEKANFEAIAKTIFLAQGATEDQFTKLVKIESLTNARGQHSGFTAKMENGREFSRENTNAGVKYSVTGVANPEDQFRILARAAAEEFKGKELKNLTITITELNPPEARAACEKAMKEIFGAVNFVLKPQATTPLDKGKERADEAESSSSPSLAA